MNRVESMLRYIADNFKKRCCTQCSTQEVVPLSRLCKSGRFTICKVNGDRKLCARIVAMGIYPGAEGELICQQSGSQCILQLHGSRLCLDPSITENIMVTGN